MSPAPSRMARTCDALADSLTGLGVLRRTSDDSYELTPLGDTLRSDSPGSMRDLALMWMHAATLLANIARAGEPGARVRAVELVLPAGDEPHKAKMIDLTMLGMLDGRERTEPEFRQLFDAAGLELERVVSTPTPLSIIEARVR